MHASISFHQGWDQKDKLPDVKVTIGGDGTAWFELGDTQIASTVFFLANIDQVETVAQSLLNEAHKARGQKLKLTND